MHGFTIYENAHYLVEQCYSCNIPGYLFLSIKSNPMEMSKLSYAEIANLGTMLHRCHQVVNSAIKPHKIYIGSFGEETKIVHFHIFPRTEEITTAYRNMHAKDDKLIDGPHLLSWARKHYRAEKEDVLQHTKEKCLEMRDVFFKFSTEPDNQSTPQNLGTHPR